ncbi:MAG: hypothetical protein ABJN22_09345 [Litorimonas sp.]
MNEKHKAMTRNDFIARMLLWTTIWIGLSLLIGIAFGQLTIFLVIFAMALLLFNTFAQIVTALLGIWFAAWVFGLFRAGWITYKEGITNNTLGATFEAINFVYSRLVLPLTVVSTFLLTLIFVAEDVF